MRMSKAAIVLAALTMAAAIGVLPVQVASAQPPSSAILIPSSNATVSGTSKVLDATASSGTTQVQFEITGGALSDAVIATATPTIYGWIALWNTTTVANGTYTLQSVATQGAANGTSAEISITVDNAPPSSTVLIPSSGAGLDTTQTYVLDAVASPGVTAVSFEVEADLSPPVVATFAATPTIYGWIAVVAGNPCSPYAPHCFVAVVSGGVVSVASYPNGVSAPSSVVNVTISVNTGI